MAATLATVFPLGAQDQASFAEAHRRTRRLMADGDWPTARRRLALLVDEHARRPYVLAARNELLADWVRCAFFCEWVPPRPETLVAGHLVRSGNGLTLRYGAEQDGDFDIDPRSGSRYHRAWFEGERTLELAGRCYPQGGVQLIAGTDRRVSLIVDPGLAPFEREGELRHRVPRIVVVTHRGEASLAEGERSPMETGKPYALTVSMSKNGIQLVGRGRTIVEARFPEPWSIAGVSFEGGRMGYSAEGPSTVAMKGATRGAWLDGLIDGAQQDAHAAFVRRFDLARQVPAWLLDGPVAAAPSAESARPRRLPDWRRTFEWQGDRYCVRSEVDRAVCAQVGRHLAAARREYERVFGALPATASTAPFEVLVFSGRAGYEAHLRRMTGGLPGHATSGVFVPELDQLLLHNPGDPSALAAVVRHEGLHQYLHRRFATLPAWFNEGVAVYVERGAGGAVRPDLVRTLVGGRDRLVPMDRFLFLDYDGFYTRPDVHYAQAWATVHLLRHGPRAWRDRFAALLRECEGDASEAVVSLRFVGTHRFEELDAALRAYLAELLER